MIRPIFESFFMKKSLALSGMPLLYDLLEYNQETSLKKRLEIPI